MKELSVYTRKVTERTPYKKYRYKEVTQFVVRYGKKLISNCDVDISSTKLKVPFRCVFATRSRQLATWWKNNLAINRTDAIKWLYAIIDDILGGEYDK